MRKLNCIFLLLLVPMLVMGQEIAKTGTAGAQFLKIGLSARAAAMADAFTVAVDNSEAVFWNPGALAVVQTNDLSAAYVRWPADITYSGAAAATYLEGTPPLQKTRCSREIPAYSYQQQGLGILSFAASGVTIVEKESP